MKEKDQILKAMNNPYENLEKIQVELLLDIRELLIKLNEGNKND